MTARFTVLDGPTGTLLNAWGVETPAPVWTGDVSLRAPGMLERVHRAYAEAGARVHTAATFRTTSRLLPNDWEAAALSAVACARRAIPSDHRVAGSLAPWEDCYRPDLAPSDAFERHLPLARTLASAGVDLLLCETFCNPEEGLGALRAALETGVEVWISFSAGPDGSLMTPAQMARGATAAGALGAACVLVNCVDARCIDPYVDALASAGVVWGVSPNAGALDAGLGWGAGGAEVIGGLASGWIARGASVIGGCCGLDPSHIAALSDASRASENRHSGG